WVRRHLRRLSKAPAAPLLAFEDGLLVIGADWADGDAREVLRGNLGSRGLHRGEQFPADWRTGAVEQHHADDDEQDQQQAEQNVGRSEVHRASPPYQSRTGCLTRAAPPRCQPPGLPTPAASAPAASTTTATARRQGPSTRKCPRPSA